jgi:HAD superfamily hydrolase (TIGR01549 family)
VIRALIFDYFGVVRTSGIRTAFTALGGDLSKDEIFVADVTTAASYGYITDGDQQLADRLGVSLETWREAMSGAHGNDPVLLGFIADVHSAKLFRTGLLTNTSPHSLANFFKPGELETYFDVALTSGDTGHAKPEAAFYRMMAKELGVMTEECIMIDDRKEFCEAAEHVGMKSIEYRHYKQFRKELETVLAATA